MATNNISELIKSSTGYMDYTADYLGLFRMNRGGNKSIYAYVCYGENREINRLADNINDIDMAIGKMWDESGLTKEHENWDSLPNTCQLVATDNDGNILLETPKRFF